MMAASKSKAGEGARFKWEARQKLVADDSEDAEVELVDAGKAVRVRGRIGLSPHGRLQLIGCFVMVEEDSNIETLVHILREAANVELGKLVRVRGTITLGAGDGLQLTVRDVLVERNPNMEILHWMDCIRLARNCSDSAARP
ncbi:hypothetical protein ZIOFF_066903 [Zingiber officinale]|uniref:Uncharacterized protein n=1 Tax=Zingiber officinale TaxID=94328 RepID=A0A8J5EVC5_ZINOF|nr:hypothetical protein ZIOFF_066903 [Zingiber officinale]